jgi:hypothetical protein
MISKIITLFFVLVLSACGAYADTADAMKIESATSWECGLQEDAVQDKYVSVRYHGQRYGTDKPCYGIPGTHHCDGLPYTKNFTWHFTNADDFVTLPKHSEVIYGFRLAIGWLNAFTGFTFTETGPSNASNAIPISWSWDVNSNYFASGGCDAFVRHVPNAPGQVYNMAYYRGCDMNLNVGNMGTFAEESAGIPGYDITNIDVGWTIAFHEFGHIMGLAHAKNGIMREQIPLYNIDLGDYTPGIYSALNMYNPNPGTNHVLVTIPGFAPHISE